MEHNQQQGGVKTKGNVKYRKQDYFNIKRFQWPPKFEIISMLLVMKKNVDTEMYAKWKWITN